MNDRIIDSHQDECIISCCGNGCMKKNMGRIDQVLRMGISLGLIYLGLFDYTGLLTDPLTGYIAVLVGLVNLFVAILRYCPLYRLAGINTCQKQPSGTK
ncbi:hypothetical protein MNBD_GAMMA11-1711 [hydrothermal vent metagenome]|uniref:Inner membrane protein YgaP-like transmembrane domain-containing protein n=1 Tax=hydrothermal vent metagenome TaxID=652676 RepID=A0A3B0XE14_9ZZZZ